VRRLAAAIAVLAVGGIVVAVVLGGASGSSPSPTVLRNAASGKSTPPVATVQVTANGKTALVTKRLPYYSAGTLAAVQDALGVAGGVGPSNAAPPGTPDLGASSPPDSTQATLGCSRRGAPPDRRVNQDCGYRRQAEESIAVNPTDAKNLLAGMNDSRVGFNQCGIAFSTDNGSHWGDLLPPFRAHVNSPEDAAPHTIGGDPGTFHTYDAASDPGVAFDSRGRGFFSCVVFDIFSNASGVVIMSSPPNANGSFFSSVPMLGGTDVAVEDNSVNVIHDKPFITADTYASSPNRDNVYVVWTVFFQDNDGNVLRSPIYGSMSTDHGRDWSLPEEISGRSKALCFHGDALDRNPADANACNFDQAADLKVLGNGDLAVVFTNANTKDFTNNQVLAVHCQPSGSTEVDPRTAHLDCGSPVKVGDDIIVGEPQCDFGRGPEECIPGIYARTSDFPRAAVNPANGHVYVTWQDYRNGEYDVQLASSTDGGATWGKAVTVNPDTGLDHTMPAIDVSGSSSIDDRVGVSYYRSQRVPNENMTPEAGFAPCGPDVENMGGSSTCQPGVGDARSDYVLAGGRNLRSPYPFRLFSPVFGPPDQGQSGFLGDYSGLVVSTGSEAHGIWSDTRNVDPFGAAENTGHDEDVFTDRMLLPDAGVAKPSTGVIGQDSG
jgi:hypothetical protein